MNPVDPRPSLPNERSSRESGLTLVEVAVSAAIIAVLSAIVLNIALQSTRFIAFADADYRAQYEGNRAFTRMTEILRKTGWNDLGGTTYPLVSADGSEISFNLLEDADGNGYPFSATDGELEWDTEIYTIRLDATDQSLQVYDSSDNAVWMLGRGITAVNFSTYLQDPTRHFKEIRIQLVAQQQPTQGDPLTYAVDASVHMRN